MQGGRGTEEPREVGDRSSSKRVVRVLLGQVAPVAGPAEQNLPTLARALAQHPDVDLAVFPELFLTGFDLPSVGRHAVPVDGDAVERVQAVAAKTSTAVILGYAERAGRSLYDSLLVVDADGSIAGNHRKTHLFGDENSYFCTGSQLQCVRALDLTIAPMICYELEFPEVARVLAAQDADLLVGVAANMDPYGSEHRIAIQARALENRTPLVYVNRVGEAGDLHFVGGSCVVGPNGAVREATPGPTKLSVLSVMAGRDAAEPLDYWRFRRTDLY